MKTLTERIADACKTHDIRNVLGLSDNKRVILCPLPQHVHNHGTPSFSIFWRGGKQWWRCHGSCNAEGDVVDLVGYLRVTGYDKKDPNKIRAAVDLIDDRFEIVIPMVEPEVVLTGSEWRDFLPPGQEAIGYALRRGLSPETIERYRIGQFGHYMAMPCFEEGILKGIKMRNIWQTADNKQRFWQLEGSRIGLFGYDDVYLQRDPVFIVKGEIPVMLMQQIGFHACAPTAGEGSGRSVVQRWTGALAVSPRLVIGDNDGPGQILGMNRSVLFGAKLYFPPNTYKDIDEWILAEPTISRETLAQWAEDTAKTWWD